MPIIISDNSPPSLTGLGGNNPLITISKTHADTADMRPLRIGLINNMPDAALRATEEQFLSLIGSEAVLQIEPVLMSCSGIKRSGDTKDYIQRHYARKDAVLKEGLDAVIFSGANFGNGDISGLPFWEELTELFDAVKERSVSILTSCLATHALMKHKHDIDRILQEQKVWGVFPHEVSDIYHPLIHGLDSDVAVPHSRWNNISRDQFEECGYNILMESTQAGVHLVVSNDFQYVMMQGHPEYSTPSLAREFLRDKKAGLSQEPVNYVTDALRSIDVNTPIRDGDLLQKAHLKNNWQANAKVMMANWIGLVYKLTHVDLRKKYMEGIDPEDPIGSLSKLHSA